MILTVAAVCAAAVLLAVVWYVGTRKAERVLRSKLRCSALVTLKSGETFSAVLKESDASCVVLAQVTELGQSAPVDGELMVRWSDVAYVQLMP